MLWDVGACEGFLEHSEAARRGETLSMSVVAIVQTLYVSVRE